MQAWVDAERWFALSRIIAGVTMSAKYHKPYTIPEEFPALLKAFTREILRSQPDNIYQFGAEYFANLKDSKPDTIPAGESTAPPPDDLTPEIQDLVHNLDIQQMSTSELEPVLMKLFMAADADASGYLDKREFQNVLQSAHLNLSERQIRSVMCEADENADGVIEYREFVPFMVDVIQSMKAADDAKQLMARAESIVRVAVEDMLLNGMTKPELESLMLRIFRKADADHSGKLSSKEFRNALKAAKLGLTRKDINLLMFKVDANGDGEISYEEFVPVCFQVLVERFKDKIIAQDVLTNHEGLQGLLLEAFQAADPDGSGVLPLHTVRSIFKDLSFNVLGLSTLQLVTLASQAPTTEDGLVNYPQFVPVAASMVYSMYDVDQVKLRIQAVKEMADAGGVQEMATMDLEKLRAVLQGLFEEADPEQRGVLQEADVMRVIDKLSASESGMNLSEVHTRAMFMAIDTDDNGLVDWPEFVSFICDAIEHLERENYIASLAA